MLQIKFNSAETGGTEFFLKGETADSVALEPLGINRIMWNQRNHMKSVGIPWNQLILQLQNHLESLGINGIIEAAVFPLVFLFLINCTLKFSKMNST